MGAYLCASRGSVAVKLPTADMDVRPWTFAGLTRAALVRSVYDGDTIVITTTRSDTDAPAVFRLRLYGIDAPELKPALTTPHRAEHMLAAKHVRDVVSAMLPVDALVHVNFEPEDKYGRLLGTVTAGSCNVNAWLVANGAAQAYYGKGPRSPWTLSELTRVMQVQPPPQQPLV